MGNKFGATRVHRDHHLQHGGVFPVDQRESESVRACVGADGRVSAFDFIVTTH